MSAVRLSCGARINCYEPASDYPRALVPNVYMYIVPSRLIISTCPLSSTTTRMSCTPGHARNTSSVSNAETFVRRSPVRDSNGTIVASYAEEKVTQEPRENPKYPPVIPPPSNDHSGRTLIVCFDGTGDQFDNDNSNVVKFLSLLKKDNRSKQLVYYQVGDVWGDTSYESRRNFHHSLELGPIPRQR